MYRGSVLAENVCFVWSVVTVVLGLRTGPVFDVVTVVVVKLFVVNVVVVSVVVVRYSTLWVF